MRYVTVAGMATDALARATSRGTNTPSLMVSIGPTEQRITANDTMQIRVVRGRKTITDSAPTHGAAGGT